MTFEYRIVKDLKLLEDLGKAGWHLHSVFVDAFGAKFVIELETVTI